jgi:hypothetical protein
MTQELSTRASTELAIGGGGGVGHTLNKYTGQLELAQPRQQWIATISAGYRLPGKDGHAGNPAVSRDGRIHLHDDDGQAPDLAAALEATGHRSLTISFPWDDLDQIIQERFTVYQSGLLAAHGDHRGITVLKDGRRFVPPDSEEFQRITSSKTCKVSSIIFFCLGEWSEAGPELVWGERDGYGVYAIRTTSKNSTESIRGYLQHNILPRTHGRLAGLLFELFLTYRNTADGSGTLRRIPVWTIRLRPPGGVRLSSRNFVSTIAAGLEQGAALMLPAPSADAIDEVLSHYEPEDQDEGLQIQEPDDHEIELLERGGPCDRARWTGHWHALARDTQYGSESGRRSFLFGYTGGRCSSLSEFLQTATDTEASDLIVALGEAIHEERQSASQKPALVVPQEALDRQAAWTAEARKRSVEANQRWAEQVEAEEIDPREWSGDKGDNPADYVDPDPSQYAELGIEPELVERSERTLEPRETALQAEVDSEHTSPFESLFQRAEAIATPEQYAEVALACEQAVKRLDLLEQDRLGQALRRAELRIHKSILAEEGEPEPAAEPKHSAELRDALRWLESNEEWRLSDAIERAPLIAKQLSEPEKDILRTAVRVAKPRLAAMQAVKGPATTELATEGEGEPM